MADPRRLVLHEILCDLLTTRNVYYQPPSNISMDYPCVIYSISRFDDKYADDLRYNSRRCYEISIVDRDPDSEIPDRVSYAFEMCSFSRRYVSDNLYHTVYSVYF